MPSELECCPRCGALPCDWVNNPHHTPPAVPNFNKCADGDEWVDDCHFSPTGFAVWRCEGDRKFCTCKPATQADDALVETDPYSVVGEMLEYFDSYSLAAWAPVAAILHRERAAAHAAGEAKGRAAERAEVMAWLKDQSVEKQDREWMGPLDIADAIERGQHKEDDQ